MCSGPGADTALFRHLMVFLECQQELAAVPWGSHSEHTALGKAAAGRCCGVALASAGKALNSFPARSTWVGYGDHLCFAEHQPGAQSTCAVSMESAGFHLQCFLVVYDPLHRWNVHLWAELVAGCLPCGLCSRPFGWAEGGSLLCWFWFQRFFLAILQQLLWLGKILQSSVHA